MDELVSIIMPSYNTALYIRDSIESVLAQTYDNWELIIVDDCSTDNTDKVVEGYLKDSRIKYLKNDENCGAAISRNRALSEAKGKWIAFLDSDDLWMPEKLKKQISFMKREGYYFTYTEYSEIDQEGRSTGMLVSGPKHITKIGFFNYCWPGCLTVMYDQQFVGLIQIEDLKKNNDYAMWLKICRVADCYLLNENLAYYRHGRKGSISTNSIFKMVKWHYKLFRVSENQSPLLAMFSTCRNLLFGFIKSKVYKKQIM